MKPRHIVAAVALVTVAGLAGHAINNRVTNDQAARTIENQLSNSQRSVLPSSPASTHTPYCDPSLWAHVYTGDPRKFSKPQDRLKVIMPCVSVTGVIVNAKAEADGDYHIRLRLDPKYKSMLNPKNISGQKGYLVLEPVCENPVTQKDTIQEGVCKGFSQTVFTPQLVGKRVTVVGVYVTDMEHGWNEIHPVTSITPA